MEGKKRPKKEADAPGEWVRGVIKSETYVQGLSWMTR